MGTIPQLTWNLLRVHVCPKCNHILSISRVFVNLNLKKVIFCGELRDSKENILGNPRGYACRIELEFVENLKFLAFPTTKNTKEQNKHITKNKLVFLFFWFRKI